MNHTYPFDSVLVRNRLGQGMSLQICPFSLSPDHICILVSMPEGTHWQTLSKNADYIVSTLRERFSRKVKTFTMLELRWKEGEESWYNWQFNWVGDMPMEPKCQKLSSQQQAYYQSCIMGLNDVAQE